MPQIIANIRKIPYYAWADDAAGTGFTTEFDPNKPYMALLNSSVEIDPLESSDFDGLWFKVKGDTGEEPAHQWNGTQLRFQNPNGTWGNYTQLKGDTGATGPEATYVKVTTEIPDAVEFDENRTYGPDDYSTPKTLTVGPVQNGKEVVLFFSLSASGALNLPGDFIKEPGSLDAASLTTGVNYYMRMKALVHGDPESTAVLYTIQSYP